MKEINSSSVLARDICNALGIPFDGLRNIEIHCKYGDVAILKTEKIITKDEADKLSTILQKYEIVPKE